MTEKKEEKEKGEDYFSNLFKWNMDENQLQNQIENYDNPKFFSSRKTATTLIIVSTIFTLVLMIFGWWSFSFEMWPFLIVPLTLAFFIYRGKKWAIIGMMLLWTFDKGFQLVTDFIVTENLNIMLFFWWLFFMTIFWQAYQVERARSLVSKKMKKEQFFYCIECGQKLDSDSNFCIKCGQEIN